jgi:acyl carrier protein|tara:strand:- start:249 stop:674 length:426 start_codon:yes stop_codon:yes gene_type:complete
MKTYNEEIEDEAKEFIEYHKEDIKDIITENNEEDEEFIFDECIYQDWDLNDKIHEWADSGWFGFLRRDCFNEAKTELTSCAMILELCNNKETDYGLWENQEPTRAINTQAFFSVRNDLYSEIEEKLKEFISEFLGVENGNN